MVMVCPDAFTTVLLATASVLVKAMVPSQLKVTVPPPARAARKAASFALFTTPAEKTMRGRQSSVIIKPSKHRNKEVFITHDRSTSRDANATYTRLRGGKMKFHFDLDGFTH